MKNHLILFQRYLIIYFISNKQISIFKLPLYTCPDCEAKIRLEEKETGSSSTVTSQVEFNLSHII
jgi:hypothetical protein